MTDKELIVKAKQARLLSYAPYSNITVGAALLCKNGRVYLGCNIENAAFSPSACAERVAFFKAISEGEREFEAIAVVGGRAKSDTSPVFSPCGVCRQVMREFCTDGFRIILEGESAPAVYTLDELLPISFNGEKIK